ncbi:uncharacterized protein LOC132551006 [Ylistrum balloti]|uniref:uncharacterized protein LOC132551006 n=1 Tax=Ylistrum balloti TaxID=509963 RepID=UPI002905943C|nr:uncharacterized protein LOC132551006 [Ylistrum balloti]
MLKPDVEDAGMLLFQKLKIHNSEFIRLDEKLSIEGNVISGLCESRRKCFCWICTKSKVAPKHGHTIPRLELCAAVTAVELAEAVSDALEFALQEIKFYSDSKVVLGYIQNRVRRFSVYVDNRVARILKNASSEQWFYVRTDQGTRQISARSLKNSTWLQGPSFLRQKEVESFDFVEDPETDASEMYAMKCTVMLTHSLGTERFQRFSQWSSLVKAIMNLKLFVRHSVTQCEKVVSVQDYLNAERFVIKQVQQESFSEDISCFQDKKPLPRNSSILSLNPFLDKDGLLKVGGRLNRADLDKSEMHPWILPQKHHVSTLIVRHFHNIVKHQGRNRTEGAVRSGDYWIIGSKRLIASVIHSCVKCRKLRGKELHQIMSELPKDRVIPSSPFTSVGVDVFGPWQVIERQTRGGLANSKRWGVLYTCLASRAIHIEIEEEMTTSAFINATRRFMAIRGKSSEFR